MQVKVIKFKLTFNLHKIARSDRIGSRRKTLVYHKHESNADENWTKPNKVQFLMKTYHYDKNGKSHERDKIAVVIG